MTPQRVAEPARWTEHVAANLVIAETTVALEVTRVEREPRPESDVPEHFTCRGEVGFDAFGNPSMHSTLVNGEARCCHGGIECMGSIGRWRGRVGGGWAASHEEKCDELHAGDISWVALESSSCCGTGNSDVLFEMMVIR